MFKSNYFEEGLLWNGVIFPVTLDSLKPYKLVSSAIRPEKFLN